MTSPFSVPQWDVRLTAIEVDQDSYPMTKVRDIDSLYTGVIAETALSAEMKVWVSLPDTIRCRQFKVTPSKR